MNTNFKRGLFILQFLFLAAYCSFSQSVGIGTITPDPSAALDITATNKGLLIPRMNINSINAILNPARGLLVYDSVANQLMVNIGNNTIPNWQVVAGNGNSNGAWSLAGNNNTNPAIQFVGTTDNQPLHFRINNIKAGELNPATGNIFWGKNAGQNSQNNITGANNIAIGTSALQNNTTGTYNIASGFSALFSNTTGYSNTANGVYTLQNNTTGNFNTAIGQAALSKNTTGYTNTAVGYSSLQSNNWGASNTAVGYQALWGTIGSNYNTAIGYNAGYMPFFQGSTGLGWNNTIIGANTTLGNGVSQLYNCVAIGESAHCTDNNQVRIGNSSTTSIGGYAQWTNISDGRYKKNIKEDVKGLDFIMKLRPVTYQLDITGISKKLNEGGGKERDELSKKAIVEKEKAVLTGFVAQEVEKAAKEAGYNFSGVDVPKSENEFYGLRYSEFVVPLVKAMQEQQQTIQSLQQTISTQNSFMGHQDKKMVDLQRQLDELKQLIQHSK